MLMNNQCWDLAEVVEFFDNARDKVEDVYPSEWFFLRDKLKENISVLDIGCAQGGFSNVFSKHLKNFSYTGIDISANMIKQARQRFPQHQFHHCVEGDYSILQAKRFDLVLVLGILHLHETWRNTIAEAWKHTATTLILDLRETALQSIEDKSSSYFNMAINDNPSGASYQLPYNIINSADALAELQHLCPGFARLERYGYFHPVSQCATSPHKEVMVTVYCIQR